VGGSDRVFAGEVAWAVQVEGAVSLEDVVYRRLRLAHLEPVGLDRLVPHLGRLMAPLLRWDDDTERDEVAAVLARLDQDLAFRRSDHDVPAKVAPSPTTRTTA